MADHLEDPLFGRTQERDPTESASRHHVSSKRPAENSGDDGDRRVKLSKRSGEGPEILASDDQNPRALLPTSADRERQEEQGLHTTLQPAYTIDWRAQIIRCLNLPPELSNGKLLQVMNEAAEKLKEVDNLRGMAKTQQSLPRAQVIHTVRCHILGTGTFLNKPFVDKSGPNNLHLRGGQLINNYELFLERNKEIAFVVHRHYECCDRSLKPPQRQQEEMGVDIDASTLLRRERVTLLADELKTSLAGIRSSALRDIPCPDFKNTSKREQENTKKEISHPYLWYFHGRRKIDQAIDELPSAKRRYVDPFRDYIQNRMSEDWKAVDALLMERMISAKYIDYLFIPWRMVISQQNGNGLSRVQAFVVRDWLQRIPSDQPFASSINVHSWKFDGRFLKTKDSLHMNSLPSLEEKFDITDLPIYPSKFANREVFKALRSRGRMFWECRTRKYVSYTNADAADGTQDIADSRYMIDIATYKQMHRGKEPELSVARNGTETEDELESEHMECDNPKLGDHFFMCLPPSIPGFNMQKKEWNNLDVHFVKDVVWNTAAFDFLVVNPETKTLVQAVVTNHIRGQEHTDLISGKGNGLFILLHGGPGTGKTLTAESVAEIAKRPLYRVTCGDIGTKAEEVEKYLEFVLFLGRTWDCVVLLDEADVFLEQRSLVNLERNALVSVFLRVLEYYDGVLILTSNRVGIFDDAFKSRIQLNLRYKPLDKSQRLQIWNNFLGRLEGLENDHLGGDALNCGINMEEIEGMVEDLAKEELNGREIRNAISTARKLAAYKGEPLGASHFHTVINEAKEFDKYLNELHNGFTLEQIQRDIGTR